MSNSKELPKDDPYETLGVDLGSNAAAINKAYRKLALQLHPDKIQRLTPKEQEKAAVRFQAIQEAKAFLTEPEFAKAREKYDLQRASQLRRQQVEAERNKTLSDRRKRMQEELAQEEREAKQRKSKQRSKREEKEKVRDLKKQGEEMRQQYADKVAAKAALDAKKEQKEERQIRLKWSRKKVKVGPTEHSIADLMQRFGPVEEVEFLGSKGNAALVTFRDPDSCRPCVRAYADSDEMRASYVGKRKEREEDVDSSTKETHPTRALHENSKGWKERRAAERELLLRKMEREEEASEKSSKPNRPTRTSLKPFPPHLPWEKDDNYLTKLEEYETEVLKSFLSSETLQSIRFGAS